jgi:protein-tyrosine-phosphatase
MKILLVCTGNTCRSPMAAAMLSKILQDKGADFEQYHIVSAGLAAGSGWPASPGAVYAMQLQGLDISGHRSQPLHQDLVEKADIILTMTATQREYMLDKYPDHMRKIDTLAGMAGETGRDILDPFGMDAVKYVESASEIKRLMIRVADKLISRLDEQ